MLLHTTQNRPQVVILEEEYVGLSDILCSSERSTAGLSLLLQELGRAELAPRAKAPSDLVRMRSRVHYTDLDRRESRMVHLVYPEEVSAPVFISVTSAIGAALIGLREGDVFNWTDASGELRTVRVDKVEPPLWPRVRRSHS